jgi:hypothetical protein
MRQHAVMLAKGILSGESPILDGCLWLDALRLEIGIEDSDPDFSVFAMISSQIDSLPIGAVRNNWTSEALAEIEPQIQSATAWATPLAIRACQSVVNRFGA